VFTARYESKLFAQCGLFTAETWIRSQVSIREICGGQGGTMKVFSPSTSVSPVTIIPRTPHTHLHLHVALVRWTNEGSLGIPKSHALWCVGEYSLEKVLTIFK
jgi:hypothetical protein